MHDLLEQIHQDIKRRSNNDKDSTVQTTEHPSKQIQQVNPGGLIFHFLMGMFLAHLPMVYIFSTYSFCKRCSHVDDFNNINKSLKSDTKPRLSIP